MNAYPKKSWILSDKVSAAVEALVAQGAVRDLDEVVQVALGVLLAEPDPDETAWLRQQVEPAIAEMDRDPSRAIPLEEVFAELRAVHAKRLAEG